MMQKRDSNIIFDQFLLSEIYFENKTTKSDRAFIFCGDKLLNWFECKATQVECGLSESPPTKLHARALGLQWPHHGLVYIFTSNTDGHREDKNNFLGDCPCK